MTIEKIIVGLIVLAAAGYLGRRFWRRMRGKSCCDSDNNKKSKRANLTVGGKAIR